MGFCVACEGWPAVRDFCGPTVLTRSVPDFIGASHHSNNAGELAGIYYALCWISEYERAHGLDPGLSFVLEYDSAYAADVIRRLARPRRNLTLVLRSRRILDRVRFHIDWVQINSHTGKFQNERADQLAACGAAGIVVQNGSVIRWASLST